MSLAQHLFAVFCMFAAYIAGAYHGGNALSRKASDWLVGTVIVLGSLGLLALGGSMALHWGAS